MANEAAARAGEKPVTPTGSAPSPEPPIALPALPPIESLTIDSDYTPFLQAHVDATTRRAALKQLFRDPRFNIMDGLDSLVGDFSQADPIPPEMLKQLAHARHIFNPPRTMVNAEGHVVDVVDDVAAPADPIAQAAIAAAQPTEPPAVPASRSAASSSAASRPVASPSVEPPAIAPDPARREGEGRRS